MIVLNLHNVEIADTMERLISNIKKALKGNVKPRKMLGGVVGSEIEVSREVTNIDT